jgi:hypothetical protein
MTSHAPLRLPERTEFLATRRVEAGNKVLKDDRIGDTLEAVRLSDLSLLRCSLD